MHTFELDDEMVRDKYEEMGIYYAKNNLDGLYDLTIQQQINIVKTNAIQIGFTGSSDYLLKRVWVDEDGITCGETVSGQWFHYHDLAWW